MTDIVKVLRGEELFPCKANAVEEIRCGRGDCTCDMLKMEKAADEIERLRDGVWYWTATVDALLKFLPNDLPADELQKACKQARKEVERLRDALRYMVENPEDIESFHRIASVALGEGE